MKGKPVDAGGDQPTLSDYPAISRGFNRFGINFHSPLSEFFGNFHGWRAISTLTGYYHVEMSTGDERRIT
jgi:hypothetical protein